MSAKSALVGAEGVFETAAGLSRRGWIVSLTLGNTPRTDLLGQQASGQFLSAAIQVKTRTRGDFHLDVSDLSPPGANEWVVLVSLEADGNHERFCVVPRNHVCAVVLALDAIFKRQEKPWPRKMIGTQEFSKYQGQWELLQKPAEDVPWLLLPSWVTEELNNYPQPNFPEIGGSG